MNASITVVCEYATTRIRIKSECYFCKTKKDKKRKKMLHR